MYDSTCMLKRRRLATKLQLRDTVGHIQDVDRSTRVPSAPVESKLRCFAWPQPAIHPRRWRLRYLNSGAVLAGSREGEEAVAVSL